MKKSAKLVTLLLLVVMVMSVCLTGCAPDTVEDAKAKMTDKGYSVIAIPLGAGGAFSAIKSDDKEVKTVFAIMFADEETLKAEKDNIENTFKSMYTNKIDAQIKAEKDADKKQALKDAKAAVEVKVSGKWLAVGSKKAVSDLL